MEQQLHALKFLYECTAKEYVDLVLWINLKQQIALWGMALNLTSISGCIWSFFMTKVNISKLKKNSEAFSAHIEITAASVNGIHKSNSLLLTENYRFRMENQELKRQLANFGVEKYK